MPADIAGPHVAVTRQEPGPATSNASHSHGPPPSTSKPLPVPLALLLSSTAAPTPQWSRTTSVDEKRPRLPTVRETPRSQVSLVAEEQGLESARSLNSQRSPRSDSSKSEYARHEFVQKLRTLPLREQAEELALASESKQALALDLLTNEEREAILHEIDRISEERAAAELKEQRGKNKNKEVEPTLEDLELLQGMGYSREQAWMIALVDTYIRDGMTQSEAEIAAAKSPYLRVGAMRRQTQPIQYDYPASSHRSHDELEVLLFMLEEGGINLGKELDTAHVVLCVLFVCELLGKYLSAFVSFYTHTHTHTQTHTCVPCRPKKRSMCTHQKCIYVNAFVYAHAHAPTFQNHH
jgi:hypothetical protein